MSAKMSSEHKPCGARFTIECDDVDDAIEAQQHFEEYHKPRCPAAAPTEGATT